MRKGEEMSRRSGSLLAEFGDSGAGPRQYWLAFTKGGQSWSKDAEKEGEEGLIGRGHGVTREKRKWKKKEKERKKKRERKK